jgi:hypothetical protein
MPTASSKAARTTNVGFKLNPGQLKQQGIAPQNIKSVDSPQTLLHISLVPSALQNHQSPTAQAQLGQVASYTRSTALVSQRHSAFIA